MVPPILAGLILLSYAASLWWLLRRESTYLRVAVLVLCSWCVSLRLVYTTDFPTGLNEDEVKTLAHAVRDLRQGEVLGRGVEAPLLLNVLFQAQLVPIVGGSRWAIRTYPIVASVLATAVAVSVGRALLLQVAPSLAVGALIAVLPWALLYGRIGFGGELMFHQMLLLAALARLVFADGGWPEVGIGSLGLCLLVYDYSAGMAMLAMPLVAAVLANGRRRALCLAVFVFAVLGWLPYLTGPLAPGWVGELGQKLPPAASPQLWTALSGKALANLRALNAPTARDGWLAIRSAGMHPPVVLVLAAIGVLTGFRRGLFLAVGFLVALLPSVLSEGDKPSTHRMLMMFPFVAIAAGCALNLGRRTWGVGLTVVFVMIAAVQSLQLYFSPAFWPLESRWIFDAEHTRLIEALPVPPHPVAILSPDLEPVLGVRAMVDSNYEWLTVENWLPRQGASTYAFGVAGALLRPFYEHLLGFERVQAFGRAFLVTFEARDWSWLRQHGWAYEVRCGKESRRAQVPTLYMVGMNPADLSCEGPVTQAWRGRWVGQAVRLELRFTGSADVETSTGPVVHAEGLDGRAGFDVTTGTELTVRIASQERPGRAVLLENTLAGQRFPAWESVVPN
jgi:hypothetical protein